LLRFATHDEREEVERLMIKVKFYKMLCQRMAIEIARHKAETELLELQNELNYEEIGTLNDVKDFKPSNFWEE
jgi:hypothetical protein